jgi:hypothetical protein
MNTEVTREEGAAVAGFIDMKECGCDGRLRHGCGALVDSVGAYAGYGYARLPL